MDHATDMYFVLSISGINLQLVLQHDSFGTVFLSTFNMGTFILQLLLKTITEIGEFYAVTFVLSMEINKSAYTHFLHTNKIRYQTSLS